MTFRGFGFLLTCTLIWSFSAVSHAGGDDLCHKDWRPVISFIEFESLDIEQVPPEPLTIKGKLKLPEI